MWWSSLALAQEVTFEAVTRVQAGKDEPSVTFRAAVDGELTVQLSCGGRSYDRVIGVGAGSATTVRLAGLSRGEHRCAGKARLDRPNGDWAESALAFTVALLPPLVLDATADDLDLDDRRLVVHADRPLAEAVVELVGDDGEVFARETATLTDPANPTFSWVADREVLKLVVTGTDAAGIRAELRLSPWSYAIPHEDVVFASGSAEISAAEAGKLERCWADVARVLAKYGRIVDIELFVAGYTDTVGTADANRALSERRAAAIAGWFAQRGFDGPVWYQGFGEEALAVSTPDETDQLANRRALYLLAADEPPAGPHIPASDWSRR